ncbi:MAG: hypothetical protein AB8H86_28585 [Polyangiales bacterium]
MSTFLLLGLSPFSWLGGSLVSFALVFVVALGWRRFFPERFNGVRANLVRSPVRSVIRGFVISALAISLVAMLVVTVIGIPFAFAVGCALSMASYVGLAIGCSLLGAALPIESLRGSEVKQLAAGTATAFLLVQVPFLGPLVGATLAMAGIGSLRPGSNSAPSGAHPYRDAASFASL